jgi:hypothetical protein
LRPIFLLQFWTISIQKQQIQVFLVT